jgi:D-3-phosphoglycerate dehydrogenase / 2-oxoglutarate reductase
MNVLFIDVVHEILHEKLIENGFNCIDGTQLNLEEIKQNLSDITGIVIRARYYLDAEILDFSPNLKFIARSGAGMENIDIHYCENRNIQLFNAPEGNRNAVGEHALGMLLSLMNKIHTANNEVKNGIWLREKNRGNELDGKTVGIIGYGNNGTAFAKKLKGFDVEILAYDKYKKNFGNNDITESNIEQIFEKADVISFHIPQNSETIYFANQEFFEKIRKPIYLLNLSRGKIVETKALLNAIKSGKIIGAGLDVLEYEKSSFENFYDDSLPKEFSELIQRDEVLLTPHVGGWTHESYYKLSAILAEKIVSNQYLF